MKRYSIKKLAGIALGTAVLVGAVGIGGGLTTGTSSGDAIVVGETFDLDEYKISYLSLYGSDDSYEDLKEKFNNMSFEDQKNGLIDFLNEELEYLNEDLKYCNEYLQYDDDEEYKMYIQQDIDEVNGLIKYFDEILTKVQNSTTSEQLVKIIDEDDMLLDFINYSVDYDKANYLFEDERFDPGSYDSYYSSSSYDLFRVEDDF